MAWPGKCGNVVVIRIATMRPVIHQLLKPSFPEMLLVAIEVFVAHLIYHNSHDQFGRFPGLSETIASE